MSNFKRKLFHTVIFSGIYLKIILRDKMNLFWYMVFPMILALLFGFLVPNVGGSRENVIVTPDMENGVYTYISDILPNIGVENNDSLDDVLVQFNKGYIEQLIILDYSLNISAYVTEDRPVMKDFLSIVAKDNNVVMTYSVESDIQPVKTIDYIIPGTIALTLCQIGLFGGIDLVGDRKQKILRRIKINNVAPSSLILAHIFSRIGLMYIATLEIILIGKFLFGMPIISFNIFVLLPAVLIGGLTFLSIGLLISSIITNTTTANIISQCLNFPMAFLGGVYMPISILPDVIQPIAKILPVSAFTALMRGLLLDGITKGDFFTSIFYLFPILIGSLVLGIVFFRWE